MQDTYWCHFEWQEIRADKHTPILIQLGTELPSRAAWMSDILHYLTLPPQRTAAWLPVNGDRILLSLTHNTFPFMLDILLSSRACVSLLLVNLHSDTYDHHVVPVALSHVLCVLAENTILYYIWNFSTMHLMSRLKLASAQHFFSQHWYWEVSSPVVAGREENMGRAAN